MPYGVGSFQRMGKIQVPQEEGVKSRLRAFSWQKSWVPLMGTCTNSSSLLAFQPHFKKILLGRRAFSHALSVLKSFTISSNW